MGCRLLCFVQMSVVAVDVNGKPSAAPTATGAGAGAGDAAPRESDQLLDPHTAYQYRDSAASRAAHTRKLDGNGGGEVEMATEQHGSGGGGHLKSIVYGGLDGIITTFATVTSVAGAELSASIILILGIAHLFADGLSMGMGDALSEEAEREFYRAEKRREQWEMEQYMEGEMAEMIQEYVKRDVSEEDARTILVRTTSLHCTQPLPDADAANTITYCYVVSDDDGKISGGVFGSYDVRRARYVPTRSSLHITLSLTTLTTSRS